MSLQMRTERWSCWRRTTHSCRSHKTNLFATPSSASSRSSRVASSRRCLVSESHPPPRLQSLEIRLSVSNADAEALGFCWRFVTSRDTRARAANAEAFCGEIAQKISILARPWATLEQRWRTDCVVFTIIALVLVLSTLLGYQSFTRLVSATSSIHYYSGVVNLSKTLIRLTMLRILSFIFLSSSFRMTKI